MQADTVYAYAVGRIRVNEKKLLDKTRLDRMLDAKTADDAVKVLAEAGFGFTDKEASDALAYEKLLDEELTGLFSLIKEIAPDPAVFDIFLLNNDYHNLKVLLKSEFSGINNDNILVEAGTIPVDKLKLLYKERRLSEIPEIMRNAVEECLDVYNRTKDPQMIDVIMDKAAYKHMVQNAKQYNIAFIEDLLKIMIDLANIKTWFRIKKTTKTADFASKVIIDGGSISPDFYISNLSEPAENFIHQLQKTKYAKVADRGRISFTDMEKSADDFIMSYVKSNKLKPLGIKPIVGYIIARLTDIKNARIIMVGKINNLANDIIRERLRETYV